MEKRFLNCQLGAYGFHDDKIFHEKLFNDAYSGEQNKLLVLTSASYFSCSCNFDFSYPLSSA